MKLLALVLALGLARADPPAPTDSAATARWMVSTLEFGALTTLSTRTDASTVGDPFGNPYSFADVGGVPYFYVSGLDASIVDTLGDEGANPSASLTLSEASLPAGADASGAVAAACDIGASDYGDPENPPCARLVLTGALAAVPDNSTEADAATAALFARHPSFADYPGDHSFFVARMDVRALWLISAYGGASVVAPADYFAAAAPAARAVAAAPAAPAGGSSTKPWFWQREETARWMAASLTWGVLSTVSTRGEGAEVGAPFGNPYSFADADAGTPYFYASALDASVIDALASTSPPANARATLALTEAALGGDALRACDVAAGGDAENPPCARLVLSGRLVNATGTDEEAAAKAALFARHPSFEQYPADHGFFVAKLELDGIWLIDTYGGAADIDVDAYRAVASRAPAAAAAPPGATEAPFCAQVAENGGCCPACGYTWDGAACTTDEKADTPYCASLLLPAQSGCCSYCGHAWSEAQGKCVKAEDAAITA